VGIWVTLFPTLSRVERNGSMIPFCSERVNRFVRTHSNLGTLLIFQSTDILI
jgi:hypothetical protein